MSLKKIVTDQEGLLKYSYKGEELEIDLIVYNQYYGQNIDNIVQELIDGFIEAVDGGYWN